MSEKHGGRGEKLDYQSYLLRLWRADEGEEGWSVSLESAQTGERRGFADLEAMFDFLRRQTAAHCTLNRPYQTPLGDVTQRPGWVPQGTEQGNNLVYQNSGGSPEPHGNSMRV